MNNIFITINAKKGLLLIICMLLVFTHFFCYFKFFSYKEIIKTVNENIFNSFNGEIDTNEKENNIFFVSSNNDYKFLGKNLPNLKLPSSCEFKLESGVFTFDLKENLVIKSAGTGIVKKVGFLKNGLKFIEIAHSGNIITRYENLKIVGVGENFNVKNIHIIGTCPEDIQFVFKVLKNDIVINNFVILDGEIKWQN